MSEYNDQESGSSNRNPQEKDFKKLADPERRNRIREKFFSGIDDEADKPEAKEGHGFWASLFIGILNILIIIGTVVLIRTFIVSPFSIVGSSMSSNFTDGNLILVDKLTYRFSEPKHGDVVVFHPPVNKYTQQNNLLCTGKKLGLTILGKDTTDACRVQDYFVKRIIGLPGDTIEIRNKEVYVTPLNGERVKIREEFLDTENQNNTCFSQDCNSSRDLNGEFQEVPEGTVYVLGDNRTGSSDSREWKVNGKPTPFVQQSEISGKVRLIFFPFSDMSIVPDIDILDVSTSEA